jgi:hypothetical protein
LGADDTGDDLNGASKSQFLGTDSRPASERFMRPPVVRPCRGNLVLGRHENVIREEGAISSGRGYWMSHRNDGAAHTLVWGREQALQGAGFGQRPKVFRYVLAGRA